MKTHYLFILFILVVLCFGANASNDTIVKSPNDTLVVVYADTDRLKDSVQVQSNCMCDNLHDDDMSYSDGISTLTLVTEAIDDMFNRANTFFTIISIAIALAVALMGFFGFRSIDKVKTKAEEELKLVDNQNKRYDVIEKNQALNNQYLQKINQWMLANTYAVATTPSVNKKQGRALMEESMLNYYLMKLFLSKNDEVHEIDGCINYIKTKGNLDEIEHLQFIVDNDPSKYKRDKASEAIGFIRGRLS